MSPTYEYEDFAERRALMSMFMASTYSMSRPPIYTTGVRMPLSWSMPKIGIWPHDRFTKLPATTPILPGAIQKRPCQQGLGLM